MDYEELVVQTLFGLVIDQDDDDDEDEDIIQL